MSLSMVFSNELIGFKLSNINGIRSLGPLGRVPNQGSRHNEKLNFPFFPQRFYPETYEILWREH